MIKAEWTNKDSLDLQPTCNQLATDLISRQDAIDALSEDVMGGLNYRRILQSLPSTDRPTGHIVSNSVGKFQPTIWATCSKCNLPIDPWDKFCRHCGAKMETNGE